MANYFNGERIFTRCHTLAYGYDENNPELIAYSKIAHLEYTKEDNVGIQICAARRIINETYNINIPFTAFESMANLPKNAQFKKEFLNCVKEYANQHKIPFNMNELDRLISPYILNYVDYVREAASMGRLKLSDVSRLIKNAGGELVIAHPCLIRATTSGLRYIAGKEGKQLSDLYVPSSSKYLNNTDLGYVKDQYTVLKYFLDAFESVCGYKVSGLEKYYSTNFASRLDTVISDICLDRGMYETAGSDYHGEHLHSQKKIGKVFSKCVEATYKKEANYVSSDFTPIVVAGLSAVEHLVEKKPHTLPNKTIIKNDKGEIIPNAFCEKLLNISVSGIESSQQQLIEQRKETLNEFLKQRLEELVEVARRFDEIAANVDSPKKQAKLLLRLNLYAENVVLGMRELLTKIQKHRNLISYDTYKQITEIYDESNAKFQKLLRHNPRIIQELKHDMKHYYNKRNAAISSLMNYKLPEPLSASEQEK